MRGVVGPIVEAAHGWAGDGFEVAALCAVPLCPVGEGRRLVAAILERVDASIEHGGDIGAIEALELEEVRDMEEIVGSCAGVIELDP